MLISKLIDDDILAFHDCQQILQGSIVSPGEQVIECLAFLLEILIEPIILLWRNHNFRIAILANDANAFCQFSRFFIREQLAVLDTQSSESLKDLIIDIDSRTDQRSKVVTFP